MTRHGQLFLRGHVPPRSRYYDRGRFGRLFPTLPPFARDTPAVREALMTLGQRGGIMDANDPAPPANPLTPNPNNKDNAKQPAGFTFLGQFIDHDVTFDPVSSLERQVDPESLRNFRTPALELDSVYGSGRAASPHLYDQRSPGTMDLLVDDAAPGDVPRNSQGVAVIGDPRNDENLIVSQLHHGFIRFHNAVAQEVRTSISDVNEAFDEAQRLVRWHYQWVIVHEFLPSTVGQGVVDDVWRRGRRTFNWRREPFMPVEFSVAAYRFGHSQVRPGYIANFAGDNGKPFLAHILRSDIDHSVADPDDLSGGKRAPRRFCDWQTFFDTGPTPAGVQAELGKSPKPNKQIDTKLSTTLFDLPFVAANMPGAVRSLAQRNLLRHLTFELPSGQRVAREMRERPLDRNAFDDVKPLGLHESTPLWFYILREAELEGKGERLGPVGGRIVAEVLLGILQGDAMSYLNQDPDWTPVFGAGSEFGIADLLRFAGVAPRP